MVVYYKGAKSIAGPLLILKRIPGAAYDEVVTIRDGSGGERHGRVTALDEERTVIEVFEGTGGMAPEKTETSFTGSPASLPLSRSLLGRTMNGAGSPVDGLGAIPAAEEKDINGEPINPVSRTYPQNCITTGISSIDVLMTLIRGQKLPIFSGSGMSHNELAVQIARQAKIKDDGGAGFCIVFAAMGIKRDVADYFRRSFEEAGVVGRTVTFLNLSSDPIVERVLTPRCALTAAEYLAYEENMHVLVIMTDMTSYAEALREISSLKGEIPGRKGFPGYLYSDLASLYERAGIVKGSEGSVTQLPILTMPGDDITHPIPDLTAYITEGQIVLDRALETAGVYPPCSALMSLSRLMKDGIGEGYTREDHAAISAQAFACCAKVAEAKSLASVIGEEELSDSDKKYLEFGRQFERRFLTQGVDERRSIEESLDILWDVVSILPRESLSRIEDKILDKYYRG
ncbi:MAG: V-type ATP synthase subunit B [Clostridia bacterium]|nr:V-type ATP synthase subunit B [Clostridia bacterium]